MRGLVLFAAASLAGCTGTTALPVTPPPVTATVPADPALLTRVEVGYTRLRTAALRVLPWLPEPYAGRVRLAIRAADAALAAARTAKTMADQLRALREVEAAGQVVKRLEPS